MLIKVNFSALQIHNAQKMHMKMVSYGKNFNTDRVLNSLRARA